MSYDLAVVRAALGDDTLPVRAFDILDSSNAECRRARAAGEDRCLILADCQTAGRGRMGRSFASPAGAGLYMSLLFRPAPGAAGAVGITTWAAVTAAEAVAELTGLQCGIKWVNDLFLNGKKVCGILTEGIGAHVIVGIGVNLTPAAMPEEAARIAGCLGRGDIRDALAGRIAGGLLRYVPGDTSHMDAYRRRSIVTGRRVRFLREGKPLDGVAAAIEDDGALRVDTAQGPVSLRFGEISLDAVEGIGESVFF